MEQGQQWNAQKVERIDTEGAQSDDEEQGLGKTTVARITTWKKRYWHAMGVQDQKGWDFSVEIGRERI